MKFVEIIDLCYKRKKDGKLTHHAINFANKCGFSIESDLSEYQALSTILNLSKDKQSNAFEFIKNNFENKSKELTFEEVRTKTYKEVVRMCHPDFGGKTNVFQMIQELKESLWHGFTGKPRESKYLFGDWEKEKFIGNGGTEMEWDLKRWSKKPVNNNIPDGEYCF